MFAVLLEILKLEFKSQERVIPIVKTAYYCCFVFTDEDVVAGTLDGAASLGMGQSDENEEVMRALLIHEKRGTAAGAGGGGGGGAGAATRALTSTTANASDSDSDTSESDDEFPVIPPLEPHRVEEEDDDDDDFEEVGDEPMVMVGGRPCSYREVSQRPELVEQMSAQEKEAYIEMGQNLYQDMYY